MSYKCMISLHRQIDPREGQNILDVMSQKMKQDQHNVLNNANLFAQGAAIQNKLTVDGLTQHENYFPDWLQKVLEGYQFYFDDFNYAYVRDCKTQAAAQQLKRWFEDVFLPHYQKDTNAAQLVSCLNFRVMMPDDWSEGMDTF